MMDPARREGARRAAPAPTESPEPPAPLDQAARPRPRLMLAVALVVATTLGCAFLAAPRASIAGSALGHTLGPSDDAALASAGAATDPLLDTAQATAQDPGQAVAGARGALDQAASQVDGLTAPVTQALPKPDPAVRTPVSAAPAPVPKLDLSDPVQVAVVGVGTAGLALGVLVALHALGIGPGLALFSRIGKDDVLDHATRGRIVDTITARPGIHLKDLQESLGIAWGTVVHHVRRLESTGLIVSIRQGPRRLLYIANSPQSRAKDDLATIRNETTRRIAVTVLGTPGLHHGGVCQLLELKPAAVSKHLAKLARAGLVDRQESAPRPSLGMQARTVYVPTPKLATALALVGEAPMAPGAREPTLATLRAPPGPATAELAAPLASPLAHGLAATAKAWTTGLGGSGDQSAGPATA